MSLFVVGIVTLALINFSFKAAGPALLLDREPSPTVQELVISLSPALLTGLIGAQVHLVVFNGAVFAPVIKGWSVLYPSFDVTPRLSAYGLLVTIPLVVLPYVAASLLPAWRAAVTDPDTVMRS